MQGVKPGESVLGAGRVEIRLNRYKVRRVNGRGAGRTIGVTGIGGHRTGIKIRLNGNKIGRVNCPSRL